MIFLNFKIKKICFFIPLIFFFFYAQTLAKNFNPELSQAVTATNAVQMLSKYAYEKIPLNANSSQRFLTAYLNELDPQHMFFLDSDINFFQKKQSKMLQNLQKGKIMQCFNIFARYQQRYSEYLKYQLKILSEGLNKLNLNSQDMLETDRQNIEWLTSSDLQKQLWKKQFINTVISMLINKKDKKTIVQQLEKRYKNQLNNLNQTRSEDVFQIYLNAYSMLYDPHTQYFSPSSMQNFNISMSLSLEGIGAVLQSDNEYTKVVNLITGGPADLAGQLKPGDKIIAVGQGKTGDMQDILGMRLDDVVKYIRGVKGTIVRLEVIPASQENQTKIYLITRNTVKLEEQAAKSDIVNINFDHHTYKIGILRIPTFYIDFKAWQNKEKNYKSTTRDVKKLLEKLTKQQVDGIVIDLRNNGGGSLQEAIELTGLFVPDSPAVIVRNSQKYSQPQGDLNTKISYDGPLAILVNRLSASASEIFAGAMQDYNRAIILGGQTYGKGTVQALQPLSSGQLKMTIAKFYRVSGQSTQNKGIIPDIKFPEIFNINKIGESSLANALQWDTIPPIDYTPFPSIVSAIKHIKMNFNQRKNKIPYFNYIKQLKKLENTYYSKTKVALNLKIRETEFKNIQNTRLKIENNLRKAENKPLFKSIKEMETQKNQEAQKKHENLNDDYMHESAVILANFIDYHKHKAHNSHLALLLKEIFLFSQGV